MVHFPATVLGDNLEPTSLGLLNFKRLTVGGRGLQYSKRKQKAGERVSRVEWWCDTLLKQATVPMPLTVRLWAHVALIAAPTEPADCTHYLLLASKKPRAELYEIFIQCVHFSSLFPLFLPFPIPHLGPPLLFFFFLALPPNRQERLLSAMFFGSTSFLPRSTRVSR